MFKKDTIRCPRCGQQHPAGTTYCPIDGMPIEWTDTVPVVTSIVDKIGANKLWIFVGAAIAGSILCLSAFIALSVMSKNSKAAPTPTLLILLPTQAGSTAAPTPTPEEIIVTATPIPETTPDSGPWQACDGAEYLSQLRVGNTAVVSDDPPLANRVRTDAGLEGRVIGYIDPGEESLVIEGPRCVNNWVWWKVRSTESGLEGWTAEGDGENYWLIPANP